MTVSQQAVSTPRVASGLKLAKAIAPAAAGAPPDLVLPAFANEQDTAALAERVSDRLRRSQRPPTSSRGTA